MNRIYQGKVTAVQVADGKDELGKATWKALEDWQSRLWQHHELFHDAVNYYTLALAALAGGETTETAQGRAIVAWCNQVRESWFDGRRKAQRYEGPHRRLAPVLGVDAGLTDERTAFEVSANTILNPNGSTPAQRASALIRLLQLADAASDLSSIAVEKIAWLCDPSTENKTDDTARIAKRSHAQAFAIQLHETSESQLPALAEHFTPSLFVQSAKKVMGDEAQYCLKQYFEDAAKRYPQLEKIRKQFLTRVNELDPLTEIEVAAKRYQGEFPLAVLFKFWPQQREFIAAFRERTKRLAVGRTVDRMSSDPLKDVRGADNHPIFDYYTNRVFHRQSGDKNRSAWFEFDLAAFVESLKAPHRYFQDTQKREREAEKLRATVAAIEGRGLNAVEDDDDSGPSFGFSEDLRIDLLRELVTDPERDLAYLSEGDETDVKEYTIQERTLRGWAGIREKWRTLSERGDSSLEKLWSVVASEQVAHREDFGSAALYKKLTEPRYQPIWCDKGTREWHADDPLRAWREYTELRSDLKDKERQIRFTPAHPVYSPRYFIFPKSGRWGSEHESGTLTFTVGIAVQDGARWRPIKVRVHYTAPRLRRDELRSPDEQGLESAPWLQPIMKALGLREPAQQNFGNCRITLQPSTKDDIQLVFPIEIDATRLIAQLGKENRWARQFNVMPDGQEFRESTLRWPHEKKPSKSPWHETCSSFSCLSVDLGQRDAGAYALLNARANHDFAGKPSRYIGQTPGKTWRAALAASGMLRLPGEDREEWRAKTSRDADSGMLFDIREELHGSRGRMPRPDETDECGLLLRAFLGPAEAAAFLPAGWDNPESINHLSFPEQNDKLLVAARRAQSRVALLHRWCWFLGDEKKRLTAIAEIREVLNISGEVREPWLPASLKPLAVSDNDPRLLTELRLLLERRLAELPQLLVRVANRVLPLRGRSWAWSAHPEADPTNRIFLLSQNGPALDCEDRPTWLRGQRGLSMERIGQIEELRKRFQSLNQTLRREIGGEPPKRRDERVPDPCPDLLAKLDRTKEQRINQTAHMILAEALGVRLAKPPSNKSTLKAERDQHGVYQKVREPVDFIVIEDLSRYRASQGRAPRENSRLMKWCHRAVRDKLRELCEPFGIPVLETPAAYSSRFCSRTGVPGFRAIEVSAGFENDAPWRWLKDKQNNGQLTEEAIFIRSVADELRDAQNTLETSWKLKHPGRRPPRRTLLLPLAGGPIFVPAVAFEGEDKLRSAVVQADINAAINLGLRAISDPRLWTIHPRLRTERISGEVKKRGKKGSKTTTGSENEVRTVQLKAREKRKYGESGPELDLRVPTGGSAVEGTRNPNYFADVAGIAKWDKAVVPDPQTGELVTLVSSKALWSAVKSSQWGRCQTINVARVERWRRMQLEDDVPM